MSIRTSFFIYPFRTEDESSSSSSSFSPSLVPLAERGFKRYIAICVFLEVAHPQLIDKKVLVLRNRLSGNCSISAGSIKLVNRYGSSLELPDNAFFCYLKREIANVLISYREESMK